MKPPTKNIPSKRIIRGRPKIVRKKYIIPFILFFWKIDPPINSQISPPNNE